MISGLVFVRWVIWLLVSIALSSSLECMVAMYSLEEFFSGILIGVATLGFQVKCVSGYWEMAQE